MYHPLAVITALGASRADRLVFRLFRVDPLLINGPMQDLMEPRLCDSTARSTQLDWVTIRAARSRIRRRTRDKHPALLPAPSPVLAVNRLRGNPR